MNNALSVSGIERIGNLYGKIDDLVSGKGLLLDEMLQRLAFEMLHRDKSAAIFLTNIMNGTDVRMVQSGRSLSLSLETGKRMRVSRNIVRQEFQGNKAIKARVLGLINDAHARATELF